MSKLKNMMSRGGYIVVGLVSAIVLIPTAAFAAVGTFTSATVTPAVTGTSSAANGGAIGVKGVNSGGGLNTRYGVFGTANGTAGVGVYGSGTAYGVESAGPFLSTGNATVAAGKTLTVGGNTTLNGNATVAGTTALNGNATIAAGKALTCSACVSPSDISVPLATQTNVALAPINGSAAPSITLGAAQFIGPTASVNVASGQKVVVSESAALGSTAGALLRLDICYDSGGGPSDGGGINFIIIPANANRSEYTANEAYGLAPGSYTVGLCDLGGSGILNNNDYVQGWAMVITSS